MTSVPTHPSPAPVKTSTLDFKPITLADIPLINSLLQSVYSRTCDYSVGGILMWVNFFDYQFCVSDGTLFIMGRTENNPLETAFMLPIGALPTDIAVRRIHTYCIENGLRPVFSAVPEDRIDILLDSLPNPDFEELDDWADYIYDIRALASLSGKALAKKRNHFNRFVNDNPGWRFETLTPDRLPEVRRFFASLDPHTPSDDDSHRQLAHYEYAECARVLENYHLYPFEGAILRNSRAQIVAIAIGEVVGDTLFVHIEKIDHLVEGAGAAVCKLFAEYMLSRHPALRFINREEDCGDPGLRTAKEQYHPLARLKKFNVRALL